MLTAIPPSPGKAYLPKGEREKDPGQPLARMNGEDRACTHPSNA